MGFGDTPSTAIGIEMSDLTVSRSKISSARFFPYLG